MRIQHDYEELGFFLAIDRDRNGNIIRRIERGGPADRAGLRDGDRILGKFRIGQIQRHLDLKENHNFIL